MLHPLQYRPARSAQWRGVLHTSIQASGDVVRDHCRLVSQCSRHAAPSVLASLGRQSPLQRRHSLTASVARTDGEGDRAEGWDSGVSTSGQASCDVAADQKLESGAAAAAAAGCSPSDGNAVPSTSARPGSGAELERSPSSGESSSAGVSAGAASAPQAESWWYSRHDHDIWGLAVPALFRCSS